MSIKNRLAIVASHPIQYQAPLFRELASRPSLDLTVLFERGDGSVHYPDREFGVSIRWDIPLLEGYHHEFLAETAGFWSSLKTLWRAWSAIRRGNFDTVWIHGWISPTNWIAWAAAKISGSVVVLRGETNLLKQRTGAAGWARRTLLKAWFRSIDRFLSIGTLNHRFYLEMGIPSEKIHLAPYAVSNSYFFGQSQGLPSRDELKRAAGIEPSRPVVAFCGKLIDKKNPLDLLEAAAKFKGPVTILYIGEGQLRSEIERRAKVLGLSDVRITGFSNQSRISQLYAMADVLVLPSSFEPWGLVVNEAMCFGLPIIASDQVGSVPDLVTNGLNGFVYPVADIDDLARRLETLLTSPSLRREMGTRSLEIVTQWSIPTAVDRIVRALNQAPPAPRE